MRNIHCLHIALAIVFSINTTLSVAAELSSCAVNKTIHFDNLPGGAFNLQTLSPISLPTDLLVDSFIVPAVGETQDMLFITTGLGNTPTIIGVQPHSPPNSLIARQDSAMRVDYTNSPVKSFQLFSFWFGCNVASRTQAVRLPANCVFTIKGYPVDVSRPMETQNFEYNVDLLAVEGDMVEAKVDSARFKGLKKIDFSIQGGLLGLPIKLRDVELVSARMDDFAVTMLY